MRRLRAQASLPSVKGALHPQPTAVQDVRIDHRRAEVGMAEELLDGADAAHVLFPLGHEGRTWKGNSGVGGPSGSGDDEQVHAP